MGRKGTLAIPQSDLQGDVLKLGLKGFLGTLGIVTAVAGIFMIGICTDDGKHQPGTVGWKKAQKENADRLMKGDLSIWERASSVLMHPNMFTADMMKELEKSYAEGHASKLPEELRKEALQNLSE